MKSKANANHLALGKETLDKTKDPPDLRLLEILINKIIKKLEDNSYEPKVQDALKAIQLKQKLAQTSEAEKTFWQLIDDIRRQELGPASLKTQNSGNELPESTGSVRQRRICLWQKRSESKDQPESVMAQILGTIIGLKEEVKKGMLPVKTITDSFNQGKCKESQLTYQRIGRILSAMGFAKGKARILCLEIGSNSGILWDQENIERLEKIHGLHQTQETRETQETHISGMNHKDSF